MIRVKDRSRWIIYSLIIICAGFLFWFSLPDPLFKDPTSTVVFDRKGELLGARIAIDGQWRFPQSDSIPEKYLRSVIMFEDEYFMNHPGFNPVSLFKALIKNIKAGEIRSGGSTITMQTIRLSRKGKSRTIKEKCIEIILALRLELRYNKQEILQLYSGNAPFGGNVVGLDAAAWRYFGRDASSLSWAEAASLAVLPNSPSLIHPGKNQDLLLQKRNRLLKKLCDKEEMDSISYKLSILEELPSDPAELPVSAFHLTDKYYMSRQGERINTTIDGDLQNRLNLLMEIQKERLYSNEIRGAACIIVDVNSAAVLAYYGNIRNADHPEYGGDVDIINSSRSAGSILKPLLYTEMLYRGDLLPDMLIADIPTRYRGYSPKNFNRTYDGVVKASDALSRSLNVPAVRMLNQYGNERFHHDLRDMGLSTITKPADHYGLSLILGGAEVRLWELAGVYSSMARVLNNYSDNDGRYLRNDWKMPILEIDKLTSNSETSEEQGLLGAGAIWLCMEALTEVNRPETETGWNFFTGSRKVAWKTGTSFGFRDGWAIGTTPDFTVAVWIGNPNGEGRPGLTGIITAAPVLFEVMNLLPRSGWFETPYDDLVKLNLCTKSGHIAGPYCNETDSIFVSPAGRTTTQCPYHQLIHLSNDKKFRVNSDCFERKDMKHEPWFILPPAQEYYYRRRDAFYKELPSMHKLCMGNDEIIQMQFIYPDKGSIIYIPKELDGTRGNVIFEATHRNPEKTIYWHVDNEYITSTTQFHEISVQPSKGIHLLSLVDEDGNSMNLKFELIDK